MKTKLSIIAIGILSLVVTSCEKRVEVIKPEYYTVYQNEIITVELNAKLENWAYSYNKPDDNNFFYVTFNMPELTEEVCKTGLVKMYRVFPETGKYEYQMEMPYVRPIEEITADDTFYYTETIDYDFEVGKVTVYYRVSDFYYEDDTTIVPNPMRFRCVIMP